MSSTAQKIDFADAAARLAAARTAARERRRFRRAPLVVGGRLLDPLGREHDCRTADISPGDVRLAATVLPEIGSSVVIYLEGLGRLAGSVARRCGEDEVAVIFQMSAHKRERMAEALTWMINKEALGLEESDRRLPGGIAEEPAGSRRSMARIEIETGGVIEGEVLDFSLAGITVQTPKPPPPLGSWVRVGGVYGRVARLIEGGFAVDFEPRTGHRRPA
jgi:hypothetical protein